MGLFFRQVSHHWFLFIFIYGLILLFSAAQIGGIYGVHHLFSDGKDFVSSDSAIGWGRFGNSAILNAQFFLVNTVGICWIFSLPLERDAWAYKVLHLRREFLRFVFIRTIGFAAIAAFVTLTVSSKNQVLDLLLLIMGTVIGCIFVSVFCLIGFALYKRLGDNYIFFSFLAPITLYLIGVSLWPKLIPVAGMHILLEYLVLIYCLIMWLPAGLQFPAFAVIGLLIGLGNGMPLKYQFAGIVDSGGRDHYVFPLDLKTVRNDRLIDAIDPKGALIRWLEHRRLAGEQKPKLVVITTSGGAYRAAFWTALVLDKLIADSGPGGKLPGFTANTRLLTGASGGMVASAYFAVASQHRDFPNQGKIVSQIEKDTLNYQSPTPPIVRDSLSPVAQQLIQHDLPGTFWPFKQYHDRGAILEKQWSTINVPFASLRESENEGLTPSLIISPMIVETGQPLLISNLDLTAFEGGTRKAQSEEFFKLFPASRKSFSLSTAVRMNATFPFISPAVSLPTNPERRLVDAGYYDNYGVNLAVTYLLQDDIRDWIKSKTSGIAVIQIRAFPLGDSPANSPTSLCQSPPEQPQSEPKVSHLARSFQWITSPLEGVASARGASMTFRNDQELRAAQLIYGTSFLRIFRFENTKEASLSWYLPTPELDAMRGDLSSPSNQAEYSCLVDFWRTTRL